MSGKDEAYLIVLNGPLKGGVFVLSKISVFEIGRADSCHIKLPDETCGFNHARISVRRGEWRFTNLNEERGSSINDIKVDTRVLEGFEVIRIGKTELQFTLDPPQKDAVAESTAETVGPREARSVGVAPKMLGSETPAPAASMASSLPAAPREEPPARPRASVASPPPAPGASPPSAAPSPVPTPPVPTPKAAPALKAAPPPAPTPKKAAPAPTPPAVARPAAAAVTEPEVTERSQSKLSGRTESLVGIELPPGPSPKTTRGFRVKVIDGCEGDLGREVDFLQGATCIVGRSVSSDFMLVDGKISRAHCSIELRDGVLILCDLESSNGTIVNGERVQKTVIKPGDYIRLGFTVLGIDEIDIPTR